MNVLVAVASKHGSTREIAEAIAEELRAQNLSVTLQDGGEVQSLAAYDAIVFGSAIYAGRWLEDAKRFAELYQAELSILPVWLFSSGPLGAENPQPHDDPALLAAPMGQVKVRDHQVFVGKLELSSLGFGERLIAKAVRAPYGDFRNWETIRAWARGVASQLLAESTVTER